ncbi:MAG: DUF1887 family protein [Firmicutes bacterium]|nr:DUF1887 family protein [Bacillota bacterium]
MKTLIELHDERAIENVIGPETFRPETVVYLCTHELSSDKVRQEKLREFFAGRGLKAKIKFIDCSMYKSDKIYSQLHEIAATHEDCAVDVTGGTDAELFAAGMFCRETGTPAFTYSRKKNRFYNIAGADFAEEMRCSLKYHVADFFLMAGGKMREGRVDNRILADYMRFFDPFFELFLRHRRRWPQKITFMQRISRADSDGRHSLKVEGAYYQKGEHGGKIKADENFLSDFEKLGFIKELTIRHEESVSFTFRDEWTRSWLRDVGSVLELYMYKICIESSIFDDVVSSAVVDWDGSVGHDSVSNEIDVVASRGITPVFISCKACEVGTYALNELAILRDRFGGKGAKAVIVTTENCNAATRHRAAQLGIAVIDIEELESGEAAARIKTIMKVNERNSYEET